jgi:hypothetical protein
MRNEQNWIKTGSHGNKPPLRSRIISNAVNEIQRNFAEFREITLFGVPSKSGELRTEVKNSGGIPGTDGFPWTGHPTYNRVRTLDITESFISQYCTFYRSCCMEDYGHHGFHQRDSCES